MRVVQLVTGAGGMYCGSCLRDNRLAATMLAQGRDVLLLPLYTPIRTDEADVSSKSVYYGGIGLYLRQKSALYRWMPRFVDRIFNHPLLLRAAARVSVRTAPEQLGALTVSVLQGMRGSTGQELRHLTEGLRALSPDLIHLPNLMMVGAAAELKSSLGVPIVCSLAGEDIFLDALPEPHRREAFALIRKSAAHVDAFLAPTRYYADHCVTHFGLPESSVHWVPMGIQLDDSGAVSRPGDRPFTIGYLARICPEKGLHLLVEAFVKRRAAGSSCRLRIAGYLGAGDRDYLKGIMDRLSRERLTDHAEYVGEVTREQKREFLRSLDVLSVPTVYAESKGFFILEGLAEGVPFVQPAHGSFPEWAEMTEGGILFEPGAASQLAEGLARMESDAALRRKLSVAGQDAVRRGFTDAIMAEKTWAVYESVISRRAGKPSDVAA